MRIKGFKTWCTKKSCCHHEKCYINDNMPERSLFADMFYPELKTTPIQYCFAGEYYVDCESFKLLCGCWNCSHCIQVVSSPICGHEIESKRLTEKYKTASVGLNSTCKYWEAKGELT